MAIYFSLEVIYSLYQEVSLTKFVLLESVLNQIASNWHRFDFYEQFLLFVSNVNIE